MKKPLLSVLLLLVSASLGGTWLYQDMQQQLHSPLPLQQAQQLTVSPGMSLNAIGRRLAAMNLLEHPYYFIIEARRRGAATRIQAGEYALEPGITPAALLDRLVEGRVVQYALTLPEGLTWWRIMELLRGHEDLERTLSNYRPATIMSAVGYPGEHPEGRFYPDTYHFPAGTTDVEFLRRAYATMQRVLQEEWQSRATGLPYENAYQALVMASIVEKETAVPAERNRIAGVFVRRLQRGMRLQTDPTVIYALGREYDGNIRRRDLSNPSVYNTYMHSGLPPTPIAAPGRAAVHAALHPEAGDELYFVARGDGSHYFSSSLEEHNRAVRQYQLNRK